MKKYKIAFVVNHFPSVSETFILNQITDLIDKGQEIRIYSVNPAKSGFIHNTIEQYKLIEKTTYFEYAEMRGLKKVRLIFPLFITNILSLTRALKLKIFNPKDVQKAIRSLSLSRSLELFFRTEKFDIVHVHFGQRGAVVANLLDKAKHCNFKFIVTFHGYDLNPSRINRYKLEYKNLFTYADAITVNTEYLEKLLLRVCPTPKKIIVLPAGLRTDLYKKRKILIDRAPASFNIVYCGRFIEIKAPDLAVRIVKILVHDRGMTNINLRMVGDGELKGEVENLIKNLELQDHVFLLGTLTQENVVEEMNNGHVFLLPGVGELRTGRAETQGLVIQEAQAMELPVIVSDAGGMRYGLLDGVSGFVLKERDVVSFADKIECLVKDEELRKKMGKAGRDFVVRNYDTKILGDKLLKIYDDV